MSDTEVSHDDLVSLTGYMADRGDSAHEIAYTAEHLCTRSCPDRLEHLARQAGLGGAHLLSTA